MPETKNVGIMSGMRHPSMIKLTRNSARSSWRPVRNNQYREAAAWLEAKLLNLRDTNTNDPKVLARTYPLPPVRTPSPPRRNSPARLRPVPEVSARNALKTTIGLRTGMRHPTHLHLSRNSPTTKWRLAANQYAEAAKYIRNKMVILENANTNNPKAHVREGPSVANVRLWLNKFNVTPAEWYNRVSGFGYNTKYWVGPAGNAYNKYQRSRNSENLVRVVSRSLKNVNPNNATNNINREIRQILTRNLKKIVEQFS